MLTDCCMLLTPFIKILKKKKEKVKMEHVICEGNLESDESEEDRRGSVF